MLSTFAKKSLGAAGLGAAVLILGACSQEASDDHAGMDQQTTAAPAAAPVFERAPVPPSPTAQQDLLGRGEYLVEGIVGCGNCHNGR